jgi:hypothetical protein
MAQNKNEKTPLRETIDELERLRDEIRVNAHLAAMDAKDRWHELEPQLEKAEHAAREVLQDVLQRARAVRDAVKGKRA